ncbi:MAG TPA: GTP cyclohydrolase I, partial [Alphaproteobacteria bacterium]|nr:GTP cyclohydrolase I [Alphaproteobacteria bacterium]
KLARVVDHYAARLQVQERLTQQIASYLNKTLQPKGVAVVMNARHLCREMRGVKKLNASMTTSELLGEFKDNDKTRAEFIGFVQAKMKD